MNVNYVIEYKNIRLRPIRTEDLEFLRKWRNNTEDCKFLRSVGYITEEMQKKWFEEIQKQNTVEFAIEETEEIKNIVGSVALYDFEDDQAEIGKIQIGDSAAHGKGIGRIALVMLMKYGFEVAKLNKIIGYVHQDNIQAHKNDIKVGFKIVGTRKSHVDGFEDKIEIDKNTTKEVNSYYDDITITSI